MKFKKLLGLGALTLTTLPLAVAIVSCGETKKVSNANILVNTSIPQSILNPSKENPEPFPIIPFSDLAAGIVQNAHHILNVEDFLNPSNWKLDNNGTLYTINPLPVDVDAHFEYAYAGGALQKQPIRTTHGSVVVIAIKHNSAISNTTFIYGKYPNGIIEFTIV